MMLEDVLTSSGGAVVATGAVDEALAILGREDVHCAVLDIQLMQGTSVPVAEALAARGIPYLIVTGFGARSIPPQYKSARVLEKVFMPYELVDAVAEMVRE